MSEASAGLAVGRSQLRRRIGSCVALAVLVALGGGVTLASAAAARRTGSVTGRFLRHADAADLVIDYDGPVSYRNLPGVTAKSRSVGLTAFWIHGGRVDLVGIDQVLVSADGRYLTSERPAILAGRLPDARRLDEAFITENTARATGLGLGDHVVVGLLPADQPPSSLAEAARKARRVTVRVVGIGIMTDEVVQDDVARDHRMVLTPAFYRAGVEGTTFSQTAVHLAAGASLDDVQREVAARVDRLIKAGKVGRADDLSFSDQRSIADRTRRAIRPTAIALGMFALVAGLVTLLVVGQAMSRLVHRDAGDLPALRTVGLTSRQLAVGLGAGPIIAGAIGVVGAVVVAWALSPLGPAGVARSVEPHPGAQFDLVALGVGAVVLLTLLVARTVASVLSVLVRTQGSVVASAARTEGSTGQVGAGRLGPTGSIGVGLALRPGAGRAGASRTTLVGAAASIAFFALAVTFGAGLGQLVHQPRRYGWNWDVAVELGSGYGRLDGGGSASTGAITPAGLRRVPGVAAASSTRFEVVDIDGVAVPALGLRPFIGRVELAIVNGRAPATEDEAVLGLSTARRIRVGLGDHITVTAGGAHRRILVTGIAVFPGLGRVDTQRTGLGEGVELTGPGLDRLLPCRTYAGAACAPGGGDNGLIIRYARGADRARTTAALHHRYDDEVTFVHVIGPQRSADIVDYQQVGSLPTVLAALLGLAALAILANTLRATVRERRHDLAVLKTLGFTRRQLSATLAWQAATIVTAASLIGLPVGVAAGRQLWSLFARQAGVLPDPATPYAVLAAAAVAAFLVANLIAGVPAATAARSNPTETLRAH